MTFHFNNWGHKGGKLKLRRIDDLVEDQRDIIAKKDQEIKLLHAQIGRLEREKDFYKDKYENVLIVMKLTIGTNEKDYFRG